MDLSAPILGATVTKTLVAQHAAAVLAIGRDSFTRHDLAGVECFNFVAAANLSRVLVDLAIRDTRQVFEKIPPHAFALPRLGAISLAVLGAAFEAKQLGTLSEWAAKHRDTTTFSTIKAKAVYQETAPRRRRRRQRRL